MRLTPVEALAANLSPLPNNGSDELPYLRPLMAEISSTDRNLLGPGDRSVDDAYFDEDGFLFLPREKEQYNRRGLLRRKSNHSAYA